MWIEVPDGWLSKTKTFHWHEDVEVILLQSPLKLSYKEDSFIDLQEFVVGYSKAPEQPQSSAKPICHSHTMTSTGHESATICIAAYRSSMSYALHHGRQHGPEGPNWYGVIHLI